MEEVWKFAVLFCNATYKVNLLPILIQDDVHKLGDQRQTVTKYFVFSVFKSILHYLSKWLGGFITTFITTRQFLGTYVLDFGL